MLQKHIIIIIIIMEFEMLSSFNNNFELLCYITNTIKN